MMTPPKKKSHFLLRVGIARLIALVVIIVAIVVWTFL
jgi:hypothetical protein